MCSVFFYQNKNNNNHVLWTRYLSHAKNEFFHRLTRFRRVLGDGLFFVTGDRFWYESVLVLMGAKVKKCRAKLTKQPAPETRTNMILDFNLQATHGPLYDQWNVVLAFSQKTYRSQVSKANRVLKLLYTACMFREMPTFSLCRWQVKSLFEILRKFLKNAHISLRRDSLKTLFNHEIDGQDIIFSVRKCGSDH